MAMGLHSVIDPHSGPLSMRQRLRNAGLPVPEKNAAGRSGKA